MALGALRNIHNPNSLTMGGHATECCKLVTKFLQLATVRPFDPTCRYALPVPCSESAHVRRTLLTAVEFGGDTSRASLYFSCQCAGLDGNPVAICAVSRRMNRRSKVGIFFKRETAQIATALVGQAVMSP